MSEEEEKHVFAPILASNAAAAVSSFV